MSETPTVFEGGPGDGAIRKESPSPETRREFVARADAPTRRESGGSTRQTRRLNLPEAISNRYAYLHDLPASGGEADIALLQDRSSDEQVILKSYRAGLSPDPAAMEILRHADPLHVVRLIDFHDDADGTWEIQEYCPLGSLRDWALARGGKLSNSELEAVVREITGALNYLHGLGTGIAHRDLKPANVLVRAEQPIDLVLTDFGLARARQAFTHLTTTVKGTWHYAAPEVHAKQSSAKSDWFSLGAMIYEFYTGRKLFAMDDGTEVSEDDAKARSLAHNYSTDLIDNPRWTLLASGLLTWDKDFRWGAEQVDAWLRGESPPVQDPRAPSRTQSSATVRFRLPWSPTLVATPAELAAQFRSHWDEACGALAGRPDPKMVRFLENFPGMEAAIRLLGSHEAPGPKLVHLQGLLDPTGPILFGSIPLDDASLAEQIHAAESGTKSAVDWLRSLVHERILLAYAEVTGSQQAADADYRLQHWEQQAHRASRRINLTALPTAVRDLAGKQPRAVEIRDSLTLDPKKFATEVFHAALPELVARALNVTEGNKPSWIAVGARRAAKTGASADWPWSAQFAKDTKETPDGDLGFMLIARTALSLTSEWEEVRKREEDAERLRRGEAQRQREEEARRRQEEERKRQEQERKRQEEAERAAKEEADRWWDKTIAAEERKLQEDAERRAEQEIETAQKSLAELTNKHTRERSKAYSGHDWSPGAVLAGTLLGVPIFGGPFGFMLALMFDMPLDWIPWIIVVVMGLGLVWFVISLVGAGYDAARGASSRRPIDRAYRDEKAKIERGIAEKRTPHISLVRVPSDKVGSVIGRNGETIKQIQQSTGATIEIQDWRGASTYGYGGHIYGSSYSRGYDRPLRSFSGAPEQARSQGINVAHISASSQPAADAAHKAISDLIVNVASAAQKHPHATGSPTGRPATPDQRTTQASSTPTPSPTLIGRKGVQGSVTWFDNEKGYGFIAVQGEAQDVFVHYSAIQARGFRSLIEGDRVKFDVVAGRKGPQATNVRVL